MRGSCSSRASRRFVVPGPGPIGSLCGVSSVRGGTPVGTFAFSMPGRSTSCGILAVVVALWLFGSTAVSRGVSLEALAQGGAPLLSAGPRGGLRGR